MAEQTNSPSGDCDPLVLWQLESSIFCEKARWVLDYKDLSYKPRNLPPGLHPIILGLRRRGRTVPVLDVGDRTIKGSSSINLAIEELRSQPSLYPGNDRDRKRAIEIESTFDEIGHDVRRVILDPILRDRSRLSETLLATRSSLERRLAVALHPLVAVMTRRQYGVDPDRVERAHDRIGDAFAAIEDQLRPSGYLVTDQFTVADLTGAAMLAPLLRPPEYPEAGTGRFPEELEVIREKLAARPGGEWVLEMYRRHR